ncbi:MAG: hypothetical protein ACFN40_01915 [Bacteroidota bacterium]
MKDNIYIQEIEKFNDEISIWKLIDRQAKIWWIGLLLPLFLLFCFGSYLFIVCHTFWLFCVFVVLVFDYTFSIVHCDCIEKKRKRIIQQQYPYVIQGKKDLYSRVIPEIQKQKLTELINSRLVLNKDNLSFLIESLKSKKDEGKYLYTVTNVAITFFLSAILVLFARYLDFCPTIEEFKQIAGITIEILLPGLALAIYIDENLIKEYLLNKERKQNRIIRTLENIYLEISNE